MGWLDFVGAGIFLVLLIFESIADAQMWRFQQNKKRLIKEGAEVKQPFIDSGLFRFSRHPSYFCEMGMWVTFYAFAVSASGQFWHWTGLGCLLLILVFQGSTRLAEKISGEEIPHLQQVPGQGAKAHSIYEPGLYFRKIALFLITGGRGFRS